MEFSSLECCSMKSERKISDMKTLVDPDHAPLCLFDANFQLSVYWNSSALISPKWLFALFLCRRFIVLAATVKGRALDTKQGTNSELIAIVTFYLVVDSIHYPARLPKSFFSRISKRDKKTGLEAVNIKLHHALFNIYKILFLLYKVLQALQPL